MKIIYDIIETDETGQVVGSPSIGIDKYGNITNLCNLSYSEIVKVADMLQIEYGNDEGHTFLVEVAK